MHCNWNKEKRNVDQTKCDETAYNHKFSIFKTLVDLLSIRKLRDWKPVSVSIIFNSFE